ncbi:MAG: tRNA (adenosine(37)-N6)-threonylcarbamoyltransferase complex dimerization subunit type 1 TsaB [Firmicutes bacterium]|nr:tRNA (adenosine(37)-N6)-threonylcarbamoyltransferase complex dimerization subunit type 1 TsaB [Bacillota bacterium]
MLWLAIESATLVASVAVGSDSRVLAEITSQVALTHSERLLPMIDQALRMAEVELPSVDCIAVSAGPGSFTGLRIGLATAKGLAHAHQISLYAVSTLEALAWQQPVGLVVPLLDARREQVYAAIYERREDGFSTLMPPAALALSELLASPLLQQGPVRFVGEGATIYQEQILKSHSQALFANPLHNWPRASSLALAAFAVGRQPVTVEDLRPAYIRASQAEQRLGGK